MAPRPLRPMESVVMDHDLKRRVEADLEWFMSAQKLYTGLGIPYRRSYLFTGPPGTGKSSLVMALASKYRRPICMVNLASVSSDNDLLNAFTTAGSDAFVLIEDVDAMRSAATREEGRAVPAPTQVPPPPGQPAEKKQEYVTLSGLLNAIDGVAASEGRVVFFTSNHPEKLDPALLRRGRVDERFEIGRLTPDLVEEMAQRFFPDDQEYWRTARSRAELEGPQPACEWQARFMQRIQDMR